MSHLSRSHWVTDKSNNICNLIWSPDFCFQMWFLGFPMLSGFPVMYSHMPPRLFLFTWEPVCLFVRYHFILHTLFYLLWSSLHLPILFIVSILKLVTLSVFLISNTVSCYFYDSHLILISFTKIIVSHWNFMFHLYFVLLSNSKQLSKVFASFLFSAVLSLDIFFLHFPALLTYLGCYG